MRSPYLRAPAGQLRWYGGYQKAQPADDAKDTVVERIICIALRIERIERVAVIRRKRIAFANSSWKIRIRYEIAAKRYRICVALCDSCGRAVRFKSPVGNDLSFEDLSQALSGHRRLVVLFQHRSADAGLNDMQVSKPESIQSSSYVRMQRFRVTIRHRVKRAVGGHSHPNTVA